MPEDSFHDPLNLQESRKERRARLVRRRRRTAVGLVVALIVLAAGGSTAYLLLTKDYDEPTGGTSSSLAGGVTSTPDGSGAVSTSSTSSTPQANLAPQPLDITADPEVANLRITLQDGTSLSDKTPFSQSVPGGAISVELTKKGYNPAVRSLTLDQPSSLRVWLDRSGQLVESTVRFECGRGPQQLAFSPDGRELWVALIEGSGLEIYSPITGAKTGEVDLDGKGAADLVFSKDGQTVYAVNMKTDTVYEIDRVSRTVKRRFETGGDSPKCLVLSPDESTLWTTNWGSDDVSEIDLMSGGLVRRIPTVKTPRGLYCTSDGLRLYVAGYAAGELQRIDLSTGEGTLVFRSGGSLWALAGDDARGLLYSDDNALGVVFVTDLATETTDRLTATDSRPNTLRLFPGGKVLCVSNRGKEDPTNSAHEGPEWGSVLLVDTGTQAVLDAIVGGNQCTALGVSSDGSLLAFSDFFDDRVRVYRVPAYDTLAAGNGGRAVNRFADVKKE